MLRGIDSVLAKRMGGATGEVTLEIMGGNHEKLREARAIDEFGARKIAAGWAERKPAPYLARHSGCQTAARRVLSIAGSPGRSPLNVTGALPDASLATRSRAPTSV
jgi:hypothetical protein